MKKLFYATVTALALLPIAAAGYYDDDDDDDRDRYRRTPCKILTGEIRPTDFDGDALVLTGTNLMKRDLLPRVFLAGVELEVIDDPAHTNDDQVSALIGDFMLGSKSYLVKLIRSARDDDHKECNPFEVAYSEDGVSGYEIVTQSCYGNPANDQYGNILCIAECPAGKSVVGGGYSGEPGEGGRVPTTLTSSVAAGYEQIINANYPKTSTSWAVNFKAGDDGGRWLNVYAICVTSALP